MTRTLLSSGVLTLLLALSSSTPASAIPICPSATMADYIGFGATGCQFNSLTFSNFSYSSHGVVTGVFPSFVLVPDPPSEVSVAPQSNPASLGSGGAGLAFAPPGSFWLGVHIGFDVAGPGIIREDLSARLTSFGLMQSAEIDAGLRIDQGVALCSGPMPASLSCDNPTSRSFAARDFLEIDANGFNVNSFETDFATPEPTTLLLWGASMAGLGLAARWRRRRQS